MRAISADKTTMSMLDRYRKSGGFVQLLKLLETCGPAKQEKFLEIIRSEDKRWADAIELKMIEFDRVFSWSQDAIAEIMGTLQDLNIAIVLHGAKPEVAEKIRATFSHARKRKIDDLYQTNKPSPAEIQTMNMKVVETVRQMAVDGYLRFDKLDPALALEDGIEDRLAHGTMLPHERKDSGGAAGVEAAEGSDSGDGGSNVLDFSMAAGLGGGAVDSGANADVIQLRKRVLDLGKENAALKTEVTTLKSKIERIKKII